MNSITLPIGTTNDSTDICISHSIEIPWELQTANRRHLKIFRKHFGSYEGLKEIQEINLHPENELFHILKFQISTLRRCTTIVEGITKVMVNFDKEIAAWSRNRSSTGFDICEMQLKKSKEELYQKLLLNSGKKHTFRFQMPFLLKTTPRMSGYA